MSLHGGIKLGIFILLVKVEKPYSWPL